MIEGAEQTSATLCRGVKDKGPIMREEVTLYGLADSRLVGAKLGEVIELFAEREAAEQARRDVLTDEPSLGWRPVRR